MSVIACVSRPARGEWIEITTHSESVADLSRLAPHGASGLKYLIPDQPRRAERSRPARGEWIEMRRRRRPRTPSGRLAPHGANGLKCSCGFSFARCQCLAPHGASGLKFKLGVLGRDAVNRSRPARGEWIEMRERNNRAHVGQSRPARGEWIEMTACGPACLKMLSRPIRGEWIEMFSRMRSVYVVTASHRVG